MQIVKGIFVSLMLLTLTACTAEIGSDKWCEQIKAKATGDISVNEASNYAKHCIFK